MTLILLGPSAWLHTTRPRIPPWVVQILPPGVEARPGAGPNAKDVRFGLVARLRLANVHATALELHPDRTGEAPVDKLLRVVEDHHIDQFAIYWPYGAVRPALDVEIGWLLHAMQRGEIPGDQVGVFYECGPEGHKAARERTTADGRLVFEALEHEKRTTAYQTFVSRGALLIPWSSYEDLFEFLEAFGR